MTRLRRFGKRRPLLAAAIAVALVMGLMLSPALVFGTTDVTNGTGRIEILVTPSAVVFQSAAALLALAIVWLLGWGRESTLLSRSDPEGLKLSAWFNGPLLLFFALIAVSALQFPRYSDTDTRLVLTLLFSLAVGITEEVLFRGVLMHGVRSRVSAGRALVICALAFAVAHAMNALWGQSPLLTAQQIGFTFTFGALLGAIALQTASLWPVIVLHALWDAIVIGGQLIDQAAVQGTPPETAAAPPDMTAGALGITAGVIALLGVLALVVYRRWRKRVPASAIRRA